MIYRSNAVTEAEVYAVDVVETAKQPTVNSRTRLLAFQGRKQQQRGLYRMSSQQKSDDAVAVTRTRLAEYGGQAAALPTG